MVRPAHQHRNAQTALIASPLSAQHVGPVIADVDDDGVVGFSGSIEDLQQITDERIQSTHAVVVVGHHLAKLRRVDAHVVHDLHVVFGLRFFWAVRQPVRSTDRARPDNSRSGRTVRHRH